MSNDIKNSINNQQLTNTRRHVETNAVASGGKGGNGPSAAHGADNVSLTDTARHLQALERRLADAPMVNLERVEQIRQSIAEGTYSVRADHLAEKLIELERKLGGSS